MFSVAAEIWNQIAETQPMATQRWSRLAKLDQQQLNDQLETVMNQIKAPNKVMLAFVTVAPLLLENEAISLWILANESHQMRSALPEVTTVSEAVNLGSMEYSLTETERARLADLLRSEVQREQKHSETRKASA